MKARDLQPGDVITFKTFLNPEPVRYTIRSATPSFRDTTKMSIITEDGELILLDRDMTVRKEPK